MLFRIARWLAPGGTAYMDVSTPCYWARETGFARHSARSTQAHAFNADVCRMHGAYAPTSGESFTQLMRCYSPADLRLLLAGSILKLEEECPGGSYDPQAGVYHPEVPLGGCMTYVPDLRRGSAPPG